MAPEHLFGLKFHPSVITLGRGPNGEKIVTYIGTDNPAGSADVAETADFDNGDLETPQYTTAELTVGEVYLLRTFSERQSGGYVLLRRVHGSARSSNIAPRDFMEHRQ